MAIHMHHFKTFIKDVLYKFYEKEETYNQFTDPTVRMSDITDNSITSKITTPLYSSTLISKEGDFSVLSSDSDKFIQKNRLMNNMKANSDSSSGPHIVMMKNNHNLRTKNNNDYMEHSQYKDRVEHKPLKLKVVISNTEQNSKVMNVVNDLSKTQSPIVEKNSVDYVTTGKETGINKITSNRPIMGRSALLKKAHIEQNDSLIIYDLITEKYNGVINHYLDRSYQRRRLRTESPDNCSDTIYSSPPVYSPLSVSSINTNTPSSTGPDEKSGFRFPVSYSSTRTNRIGSYRDRINVVPDESDEIGLSTKDIGSSKNKSIEKNDLKFITSTDETNIESTVEDIEEPSANSTCNSTEKSTTSVSDYDPKKFLDDALGEITSLSMAYGITNETPVDNKINDQQQGSPSVRSSNLSTLISKASNLCLSSAAKSIKKNVSNQSTPLASENSEKRNRSSFNCDNSHVEQLMKDLSLQNEIMFQVSKALNYCRTMKRFESSVELLEAEKILLVASCTKDALTREIQNAEDETYEKNDDSRCCGEVELSNLIFHTKGNHKADIPSDYSEYFLVILICGRVVLASEIVTADEKGEVHVKRKFSLTNLAADFEISLGIYAMRIGNKVHSHQEQKTNCPSPKKIFFHLKKETKKFKVLSDVVYIKPSSFTLWGKCYIRSRDLSKTKNNEIMTLKMYNTPLSASLSEEFSVKINTDVKLTNKVSGFLTIGTDNEHGCTIWNRRWCVLDGSILKYWNYPSEEVSSPLGTVNLSNCLEQQIHTADRSICARPRTLMLPIQQKQNVKKYLLSADNCSNMEQWEKEINDVVCSLRVWNRVNI